MTTNFSPAKIKKQIKWISIELIPIKKINADFYMSCGHSKLEFIQEYLYFQIKDFKLVYLFDKTTWTTSYQTTIVQMMRSQESMRKKIQVPTLPDGTNFSSKTNWNAPSENAALNIPVRFRLIPFHKLCKDRIFSVKPSLVWVRLPSSLYQSWTRSLLKAITTSLTSAL